MAKDSTIIGLSIPYIILIALTWITAGWVPSTSSYEPWLFEAEGAIFILIGCLLLIPVVILTIIFMATNDDSCEKVAFGLGLPGSFLVITGAIVSLYYTLEIYLFPSLVLAFSLPQIILSFGLLARRNVNQQNMRMRSPRRPHVQPYQTTPRRTPGGRITIPNEVRMASTYGQSLKRCPQCNNTLDLRTRVCYFCGARQSDSPQRPSPGRMPPAEPRRPSPRRTPPMETSPAYQRGPPSRSTNNFDYCPNCGSRIIEGHLFCTQCGASLD